MPFVVVVLNSGVCVKYKSVLATSTNHCISADGYQTHAKYVVLCFNKATQIMSVPAFEALKREVICDIADMMFDPAPNGFPSELNMRRNDALSNGSAYDLLYEQ